MSALPFSDAADTRGASTGAQDPYPSCGTHSRDRRVWYRYVAGTDGVITAQATGDYSTILSAYTGTCGGLIPVEGGCAGATGSYRPAQLSVAVSAGSTYYLMVSAAGSDGGSMSLQVSAGLPPTATSSPTHLIGPSSTPTPTPAPPVNDACSIASNVTALPFTDAAHVSGASTDSTDPYPSCGTHSRDRRVWYRYLAPASGPVTVDTAGSNYNTIISAYVGDCGMLQPVSDGCATGVGNPGARLSIPLTAGVTYYFMVSASNLSYPWLDTLSLHITAGLPTPTATPSPVSTATSKLTVTPTPPPPSNDSCSDSLLISDLPFIDFEDVRAASTDATDPYPWCGSGRRDRRVWYRYVAPTTGSVTLDATGTDYSAIISAYTGSCGAFIPLEDGCAGNYNYYSTQPVRLSVPVTAGVTYYFMVSAAQGSGGNLVLRMTDGVPSPPPTPTTPAWPPTATPTALPNDSCSAGTLIGSLPFIDFTSVQGASTDPTDPYPSCGSHSRDRRVWYRYLAPADGSVTLDTIGSTYQPILSAYTGECGALVPVENGCNAVPSYDSSPARMTIPVSAGTMYYFMVSTDIGREGQLQLRMSAGGPTPTATPSGTRSPEPSSPTPVPPPNDSCDDAAVITGMPYFDIEDTRGAGTAASDPFPSCGASRDRRVWYRFVASETTTIAVDTPTTYYTTIVSTYVGRCGDLRPVDGGCAWLSDGLGGTVQIPVVAGTEYYFMVSAYDHKGGSLGFRLVPSVSTPLPTSPPFPTATPRPTPAPPPNDSCNDAALVNALPYSDVANTRGASTSAEDPYPSCGNGSRDRRAWYRFDAAADGKVTVDTANSFYDTIISAYTGGCGSLVPVVGGCNSSANWKRARLTLDVAAGTSYYLMISDWSGQGGMLAVDMTAGAPAPTPTLAPSPTPTMPRTPIPPSNNACDAAAPVDTLPFFDLADTRGASTSAADPYPACGSGSRDRRVWYRLDAVTDGVVTLDTADSQYDPIVSVYTGTCGSFTPVENGCSASNSSGRARLTFAVQAGTTYYVMVSGTPGGILALWAQSGAPSPTATSTPTATWTMPPTPMPPPNDGCGAAAPIDALPYFDFVDSDGASTSAADPYPACGSGSRDRRVWYQYLPASDGMITLDATASESARIISAYTGSCDSLTPLPGGCSANGVLPIHVSAGSRYYFMVSAAAARSAGFVGVSVVPGAPPPTATPTPSPTPIAPQKDGCSLASDIPTLPYVDVAQMVATESDPLDPVPSCGPGSPQSTKWYRLVSPATGSLTFQIAGGLYYPITVSAYTGTCGALVPLPDGCNQLSPSGQMTLAVAKDAVYYFMLSATWVPYGTPGLRLFLEPGSIGTAPASPTPTSSSQQTVAATGAPTLTATVTPTAVPCAGDCNVDGQVTVDEILTMVNVALGNSAISSCPAGNANRDTQITVDEILTAVTGALNGCR